LLFESSETSKFTCTIYKVISEIRKWLVGILPNCKTNQTLKHCRIGTVAVQ